MHVLDLRAPLYSLRAHHTQTGCGFLGDAELGGMFIYFPSFSLKVDTKVDCLVNYAPVGSHADPKTLHYAQPRHSPAAMAVTTRSKAAKLAAPPVAPTRAALKSILKPSCRNRPSTVNDGLPCTIFALPPLHVLHPPPLPSEIKPKTAARLFSTMTTEEIQEHLHRPGDEFPKVRPCDTPLPCDTKKRWTAEEIHKYTGCRKFKNYLHIIQTTSDGEFVQSGEFPPSIGSYTSIPKTKRGKLLDRTKYKYLDAVHVDIAFGDCMAQGGARYIFV